MNEDNVVLEETVRNDYSHVIDEDILVKEADEFHCIGTVLGQVNAVLET